MKTYFALTDEQYFDKRNRVLFNDSTRMIARVRTIRELQNLPTEHKIAYITKSGHIKFA